MAMPEGAHPKPPGELLIPATEVRAGIARLAKRLEPLVAEGDAIVIAVMNGALVPLGWLAAELRGDYLIDYCHVTRYGGAQTGGELNWLRPPVEDLRGRTVILFDDIWDEGITLQALAGYCRERGAERVVTAALLVKDRVKPAVGRPDVDAGLRVPDRYVFGCGMDLAGRWRHLDAVYAVSDEGVA